MAAPPRFESLPSEIRILIYSYLLPPARLKKKYIQVSVSACWNSRYLACGLHTTNTAILRTNRSINRETSAVLYRDTLLVSVDWNTNDRAYLYLTNMRHHVAFDIVPQGAPLPPCVVHIQRKYHDSKDSSAARISTIFAAADFPTICRDVLGPSYDSWYYTRRARSYSVTSLPKMGYNVDKLRELIWSPLLVVREGRLGNLEGRTRRSLRLIDCTGVFEQTAAELDWDPDLDDGDDSDQEDESDESDSDGDGSDTDTSGEDDYDEEDIDEDHSDEAKSNECSDNDGSIDKEKGTTDVEEQTSAEVTTDDHQSKYPEGMMSNNASSTSSRDGDANTHIDVKDDCMAEGHCLNEPDHKVPADIEVNRHVDGIADKEASEER